MLRPTWIEIDLRALSDNVRTVREKVGPDVELVAVVKSNGFGCGAGKSAIAALKGGADAVAVGNPEDAVEIKRNDKEIPVILYGSTVPESAKEIAETGAIVTLHDLESLRAFAALDFPVDAYMKVEVGLGRLGIEPEHWDTAFDEIKGSTTLRLKGIYTHLNAPENRDWIDAQMLQYSVACKKAASYGFDDLTKMVASSHVMIAHDDLYCDAVNPGRCLFGLLEGPWKEQLDMSPVISRIRSQIIQVKEFSPGDVVGYLGTSPIDQKKRLAVVPIGFGEGFNHLVPLGEVLVNGARAPAIGRRGIEHTVIDVSDIPSASVGAEVVLLGSQDQDEITPSELSEWLKLPILELLPRLARSLPRKYIE